MSRRDRLPLTYDESRARFLRAAELAGCAVRAHPINALGPHGQELTIDITTLGAAAPRRALVLLSGVHGVEGFVCSEGQSELLERLDPAQLPGDVGVVVVHAINPWGMAHGRRQNESNVDLNRNWRRDEIGPVPNPAYDEIHHLACPDTQTMPTSDDLFASLAPALEQHGEAWIREAITKGQYTQPDGLHYGGSRTEESNRILQSVLPPMLRTADKVLTMDLHTGHGLRGEIVLLSGQPTGSPQDRFVQSTFGHSEATEDDAGVKSGHLASGVAALLPHRLCHAVVLEVGTANDFEQLIATYQEQWVHRRGDPSERAHRAAQQTYRECFTPDDPEWEEAARQGLMRHIDIALEAVSSW